MREAGWVSEMRRETTTALCFLPFQHSNQHFCGVPNTIWHDGWALIQVDFDPIHEYAKSGGWVLFHKWALFCNTMLEGKLSLAWDNITFKNLWNVKWNEMK